MPREDRALQSTDRISYGILNPPPKSRIAMRSSYTDLIVTSLLMLSTNLACDFRIFDPVGIDLESSDNHYGYSQYDRHIGADFIVKDIGSFTPIVSARLIIMEEDGTTDTCVTNNSGAFGVTGYRDSTSTATWYVISATANGYETFSGQKAFTVKRGVISGPDQAPLYPGVVFWMKHL